MLARGEVAGPALALRPKVIHQAVVVQGEPSIVGSRHVLQVLAGRNRFGQQLQRSPVPDETLAALESPGVGNTEDPELYRYGIHGKEFWVNVTVGPGKYAVRLLFANTPLHPFLEQDPEGGFVKRVLNADINGERVLSEMNVDEAAGGTFRAFDAVFKGIEPKHGIIEVKLTGVGEREAILQALEVVPMAEAGE